MAGRPSSKGDVPNRLRRESGRLLKGRPGGGWAWSAAGGWAAGGKGRHGLIVQAVRRS
jgi:hypothetical protein